MPSVNQLVSAVAFAGLSIAAPTVPTKQTFTIPRQVVNAGKLPWGQHQTLKTYQKFGAHPPEHVVSAAAAVTGQVTASPSDQYDSSYLCPVSIAGRTFQLDFDTGSSDLWVFSDLLPASQQTGHTVYPTKSNAAKKLSGYTWSISYGDGSGASGTVYRDAVTIGGATVSTQAVEAATSISSQFASDNNDGLVGLAFNSLNTVSPQQQSTFFSNIAPSLPSPILVANLKYHAAGEYDFGFTDSSKYTGSISYTSVSTANGFWEVNLSGYGVGTTTLTGLSGTGIADTGTTLLYLPTSVVSAYYKKVSGSSNSATYGGYVFPCSATLPDFYLKVGTFVSRVPGKYFNYAPANSAGTVCYGGLQSSSGIGINILGDVWLKAQYVVFDLGQTRLGIAAKPT